MQHKSLPSGGNFRALWLKGAIKQAPDVCPVDFSQLCMVEKCDQSPKSWPLLHEHGWI